MLKAMGHVVEDPEEADLYYVDAWFYNSMNPILDREPPCPPFLAPLCV